MDRTTDRGTTDTDADTGTAERQAALGARMIELSFGIDVTPDDARTLLTGAVDALRAAVAATPRGDPDAVLRHRDLGCALGLRTDVSDDPAADHAEAVEWTRRAWRGGPHPDVYPVGLAVDLGLLLVRHGDDDEPPPDALARELETEAAHAPAPAARAVLDLYAGMVRLHDCDTDDVAALDACLTRLAPVLDAVGDDLPLLDEALHAVAEACVLTERIDLGTGVVRRLRALPESDVDPVEVDLVEAGLVDARMWRDEDRDALGAVLDLLGPAHRARPDDRALTEWLAERLVLRADIDDDPSVAGEAIALLGDPDTLPADRRPEAWAALGNAYYVRWTLRSADDDRDHADRCFAASTLLGPAIVERRLKLVDDRARRTPDPAVWPLAEELIAQAERTLADMSDQGDRAELAMAAVALEFELSGEGEVHDERLHRLVDVAAAHPAPPPEWQTLLGLARSVLTAHDDVIAGRGDHGLAELIETMRRSEHPDEMGPVLAPVFGIPAMMEAMVGSGDLTALRAGARMVEGQGPAGAGLAVMARMFATFLGAADAAGARAELIALRTELDGAGPLPGSLARMTDLLDWMIRLLGGGRDPGPPPLLAGSGTGAHAAVMRVAIPAMALLGRLLAGTAGDGIRPELDELAALVESDGGRRNRGVQAISAMALSAGWTWLARARPADREAADNAVTWSEAAVAALPGVGHPVWAQVNRAAADARRLRDGPGDRAAGRRAAADALRGRTWLVLQQSGGEEALRIARSAAGSALSLARWCAEDRVPDELVAALEAGRGLVLHAALTTRGIVERLRLLGHDALAAEWERTGGVDLLDARIPALSGSGLAGDLRRRVLDALADDPAGLLDPPGLPQIRAALRSHGSDALVYLVPGDATAPGMAVIVPAGADVEVLTLSGLRDGPGGPIDRYARAYQGAHGARRTPDDVAAWSAELDELTAWAWQIAAGAVLTGVRAHAADPDRPAVVLVPVGRAALVPWHAARPRGGTPDRTLAARAVVSSTPSARLLCRAVARPAAPDGATLVLGDPRGDLKAARTEAHALRRTFYPHAEYVGRGGLGVRAAGPGSRADLLGRLTGDRAHAVVHLACHGRAEPDDPGRSALLLSDGELTLAELLGHRPTAPLALDTVVLAACSTNVGGAEYDEAFSLATAFLAAGARTAIGSLWAVPDGRTSELMLRLHHHLSADGLSPARALDRARVAILDPGAAPVAELPDGWRSPGAADASAPADTLSWAGFVHLGA